VLAAEHVELVAAQFPAVLRLASLPLFEVGLETAGV
jgi:hypothetical protein